MLVNSVMLNVMHPGRLLPRDSRVYLGTDGTTELRGPGWRDPRKWYWQFADPFDFVGCCRRDPKFDFWNHPETTEDGREAMDISEGEVGKVADTGTVSETASRNR